MAGITQITQSPIFDKQKKKLHKQQVKDLDKAVRYIWRWDWRHLYFFYYVFLFHPLFKICPIV